MVKKDSPTFALPHVPNEPKSMKVMKKMGEGE